MTQDKIQIIRENYDRVADEYALHLFRELEGKPRPHNRETGVGVTAVSC